MQMILHYIALLSNVNATQKHNQQEGFAIELFLLSLIRKWFHSYFLSKCLFPESG